MSIIDIILTIFNDLGNENNKEDYLNTFKLPIENIDNKKEINNNILNDMELKEFKNDKIHSDTYPYPNSDPKSDSIPDPKSDPKSDPDSYPNIGTSDNSLNTLSEVNNYKSNLYYSLLNPENIFEKSICDRWSQYYSNDVVFLQDTQYLIQNFKSNVTFNLDKEDEDNFDNIETCDNVYNSCENIFYDKTFIDTYQYIDLPYFNKYNTNECALQMLSLYNISSPIISLAIPIIFLILPFFIIKIQGYNITLAGYLEHLKKLFKNHILGQVFLSFADASFTTKIYLIISFGLYIFQVYQNIYSCKRFYENLKFIYDKIYLIKKYIINSIKTLNNLLKHTSSYLSYSDFNKNIKYNVTILQNYLNELNKINQYNFDFTKILELGHLMKCFYKLHNDNNIIKSLYYSFGCNGYIQNIINIQKHIKNKNMNFCKFIKEDTKDTKDTKDNSKKVTNFTNAYYGLFMDPSYSTTVVKNSYKFDNNLILTGPNAAGKTTLLKSTLFNVLLCQQIGCGFFDKAHIKIYDFIHCYINIPETSSRDSLFQAEARQCKEIINCIEENKDKNHFCVFDEIYSGTNPDEAISTAHSYLKYLNEYNVNFILTTHYYKLCKKLGNNKNNKNNKNKNKNYHMEILKDSNNDYTYTYKLNKGISKVKGGLKVLKDMNYPDHIINSICSD